MEKADIGFVGLGVMGRNLVLNLESKGFSVAGYDRYPSVVDDFLATKAKGKRIMGCKSPQEMMANLKTPRRIMMMVNAGKPVDDVMDQLIPLLEKGDILIDGGNSHFEDTNRRTKLMESKGLLFIGAGVSGGEEGALLGPSIMPGGSEAAWEHVRSMFQAIAAKVENGIPCCQWVGSGGAGHFVKMVHNGIEYGDMQLICETYQIMRDMLGMSVDEMGKTFTEWNKGDLDSYLISITAEILAAKGPDQTPIVDTILDTAGQKGTGKWTSVTSLDLGVPLTLISEAVFARALSAIKDERLEASRTLKGPKPVFQGDKGQMLGYLKDALFAAKIISYAQGFSLMREAAKEFKWNLRFGEIALLWRGGCIIRSVFLGKIKDAFDRKPDLANLLLDPYFNQTLEKAQIGFRKVCSEALLNGIPIPAFVAALSYYDGYRCARLPANLLQAQRDYFGAHTYERVDRPRGVFFHTRWTEDLQTIEVKKNG